MPVIGGDNLGPLIILGPILIKFVLLERYLSGHESKYV